MAGSEPSQRPAADDINPDALEYLFHSGDDGSRIPPWVNIIVEPEPVARPTPEMVRLQAKAEMLGGEVDRLTARLQEANRQIGYLSAYLAEVETSTASEHMARPSSTGVDYHGQGRPKQGFDVPVSLMIYLLMIGFAWTILMTLLT